LHFAAGDGLSRPAGESGAISAEVLSLTPAHLKAALQHSRVDATQLSREMSSSSQHLSSEVLASVAVARALLSAALPGAALALVELRLAALLSSHAGPAPPSHQRLSALAMLIELLVLSGEIHSDLGNKSKAQFFFEKVSLQASSHNLAIAGQLASRLSCPVSLTNTDVGKLTTSGCSDRPHRLHSHPIFALLTSPFLHDINDSLSMLCSSAAEQRCMHLALDALIKQLSTIVLPPLFHQQLADLLESIETHVLCGAQDGLRSGESPAGNSTGSNDALVATLASWFRALPTSPKSAPSLIAKLASLPLSMALALADAWLSQLETACLSSPDTTDSQPHTRSTPSAAVDDSDTLGAHTARVFSFDKNVALSDEGSSENTGPASAGLYPEAVMRHEPHAQGALTASPRSHKLDIHSLRRHYEAHTVVQLRAQARERGLPTSGLKAAVVSRLVQSDLQVASTKQYNVSGNASTCAESTAANTSSIDTLAEGITSMSMNHSVQSTSCSSAQTKRIKQPNIDPDELATLLSVITSLYVRTMTRLSDHTVLFQTESNVGQGLSTNARAASLLLRAQALDQSCVHRCGAQRIDDNLTALLACQLQQAHFLLRRWVTSDNAEHVCSRCYPAVDRIMMTSFVCLYFNLKAGSSLSLTCQGHPCDRGPVTRPS
jgi:hypothetical protein